MSRIVVTGSGAVSPAGWGVAAMMEALRAGHPAELSELERGSAAGEPVRTPVRRVPKLEDRGLLPKSPRLRRASPAGRFAAAAVLEALGPERFAQANAGELRLGVVCTMLNGCVNYSNRFFGEVLRDPVHASPIVFPETVFNAPSSHVSAVTASTAPNDTLVGDGAEFFTGLELATEWLDRGDCDACVVVAPEEIDWLSAEALVYYPGGVPASEGAAAVLLERDGEGPQLLAVPDPVGYAGERDRVAALRLLRERLGIDDDGRTLLSDGRVGVAVVDRPEDAVFAGWRGPRLSVRSLLGESLGAAAAWQTVAALEELKAGTAERAVVTAVGGNEQVAGALFGSA